MLKVLPIQTKDEQELAMSRCNVMFKPDALAYMATVDDVFIGVCKLKLTPNGGEVYDLALLPEKDDFEALFVMGRAALNFIDLCGIHYAKYISDKIDDTLLRAIGFEKNGDGIYDIDLTDFFKHPCKHHKDGAHPCDTPKK